MAAKRMYNNINKPFILIKWKIEANQCILTGSTVLTYVYQNDFAESERSHEQKLKSSIQGIVLNLLVKEGDIVQPGAPLLEFNSCSHDIVLKGICASCGKDTWSSDVFHNFEGTGLRITKEQAEHLEKSGENKLLRNQKLALLICVDEILIDKKQPSVIPEQESQESCVSETSTVNHCYELLPGTCTFLQNILEKYDVYFFTYGDSCQGREITHLLNKVCRIFPTYIWTNEDFRYRESDKEKLRTIFPNGQSMICIIDSHENAWKYDHNVIWVKSYSAFYNVRNDKALDSEEAIQKSKLCNDSLSPNDATQNCDNMQNSKTEGGTINCAYDLLKIYESKSELNTLLPEQNDTEFCSLLNINSFLKLISDMYINKDENNKNLWNYTTYLKSILFSIHRGYYHLLDQMVHEDMYVIHQQVIPDLKYVIPYVWKTVLLGINLNFSGIIPTNIDTESSPYWILAEALGANVTKDLVLDDEKLRTTHIIATKFGTNKVNLAEVSKDIFIVTINWLYHCAFCWCRVDEKHFLLGQDSNDPISSTPNTEVSNSADLVSSSKVADLDCKNTFDCDMYESCSSLTINPSALNLDLTSKELIDMTQEVDKEIDDSDSDEHGDYITTVYRRKRYDAWSHSLPLQKKKRCFEHTENNSWCDDEVSNTSFPRWDNVSNDSDNFSETESVMVDYVYSEDDDPLLRSPAGSDFSDT